MSGQVDKARAEQLQKGNEDSCQYVRFAEAPLWDISYIWSPRVANAFIANLEAVFKANPLAIVF